MQATPTPGGKWSRTIRSDAVPHPYTINSPGIETPDTINNLILVRSSDLDIPSSRKDRVLSSISIDLDVPDLHA
jgi:hypothetical protein